VSDRDLDQQARVAELLLDAARELGQGLDAERIYDRFHDLLTGAVPHDGIVVSSYDEREGLIRCDYAWSDGNKLDAAALPPVELNREGGGMQSQVIVSGRPVLFNDVPERVRDPGGTYYDVDREGTLRKLPESGPPQTRAAMMVPVKHEGQVVGVVQLMSNSVEYSADELELFEGLVGQMAAAVRNARLQKERRRLEAAEAAARAIAAEREQAAHVLEAVADAIFLVDAERTVRIWNRAAERVTGVRAERAKGGAVTDVFPGWDAVAGRIPVAEGGSGAPPVTVPLELAGRELWLSFVAVRSAHGVVYAFRDVTVEHRLEEEKIDFIATVSHELRTPTAAVHGAAQTLLRGDIELAPEQREQLVELIARQAARLAKMTDDVLLARQLDREDFTLEHETVDVAELVRTTVEAVRPQLPESMVVDVEIASEAGAAAGSRDRIQQVLFNLLDNAAKYAGGHVTVRVERAHGFVRISVADSGPGLALSEQERVFEKFYRAGPQLTRPSGGTGLGLYISRELVRRMNGRLDVRSEPGQGATFVVELPRAAAAGADELLLAAGCEAPLLEPRPE
jgi:two-component system, OmpR family, phosphate regulon sensor histidine kinase PhoR